MLIGVKFVKIAALLFIPLVHLLLFGSSLEGKSESHQYRLHKLQNKFKSKFKEKKKFNIRHWTKHLTTKIQSLSLICNWIKQKCSGNVNPYMLLLLRLYKLSAVKKCSSRRSHPLPLRRLQTLVHTFHQHLSLLHSTTCQSAKEMEKKNQAIVYDWCMTQWPKIVDKLRGLVNYNIT